MVSFIRERVFGFKAPKVPNRFINIKNQAITDVIFLDDNDLTEAGFIELENGNLISEIQMGMQGTGSTGLLIIDNLVKFEAQHGADYHRWSKSE